MSKLLVVGSIPVETAALHLAVTGAATHIIHEDRTDIEVRANNPDNWTIADGNVEQVAEEGGLNISISGGTRLFGGSVVDLSSLDLSDGRATITIDGRAIAVEGTTLYIDGKKQRDAVDQPPASNWLVAGIKKLMSSSDSVLINGISIEWRDGGVFANGKLQQDDPEATITEHGEATEEVSGSGNGADVLVLAVPTAYRGSLTVINASLSDMSMDGWSGGYLHVETNGGAALEVNGPIDRVPAVGLVLAGQGNANFNAPVDCGSFDASLTSGGHLFMERLDSNRLILTSTDMGDVTIKDGSCNGGQVTSLDMGNFKLRGDFEEVTVIEDGFGEIEIGEDVEIDD